MINKKEMYTQLENIEQKMYQKKLINYLKILVLFAYASKIFN